MLFHHLISLSSKAAPCFLCCEACKHLTPLPADFFLGGSRRTRMERRTRAEGMTFLLILHVSSQGNKGQPRFQPLVFITSHCVITSSEVPTLTHSAPWWSEHQLHGFTYRMTSTTYRDLPFRLYSGNPASFLLFPPF